MPCPKFRKPKQSISLGRSLTLLTSRSSVAKPSETSIDDRSEDHHDNMPNTRWASQTKATTQVSLLIVGATKHRILLETPCAITLVPVQAFRRYYDASPIESPVSC